MARRAGEEQPYDALRFTGNNGRSGISRVTEGLMVDTLDNHLIVEGEYAGLILHADVGVDAGHPADGVTGRAAELVNDHIPFRRLRALGSADEQDVARGQLRVDLGDG